MSQTTKHSLLRGREQKNLYCEPENKGILIVSQKHRNAYCEPDRPDFCFAKLPRKYCFRCRFLLCARSKGILIVSQKQRICHCESDNKRILIARQETKESLLRARKQRNPYRQPNRPDFVWFVSVKLSRKYCFLAHNKDSFVFWHTIKIFV